jgi:asparagine synthase (glutamine-hydrolysing)
MCGFLGFVNNGMEETEAEKVGLLMLEQIKHRGPDAQKVWNDENITLGFARLSFQDIEHGHQPMFLNDKSKCILFNGEIYNFQEIKNEILNEIENLKNQENKKINFENFNFQTTGDTEVILLGYELWGEKVLQKLRGMFAFAIFDFIKKEFFFARDNFGIKPFYYYLPKHQENSYIQKSSDPLHSGGQTFSSKNFLSQDLFFGSEIKAFLKHPNLKREFNEKLLSSYLTFSCIPATINETFFKNVFKLPPAHFARYSLETGEFKIEKYWQASFDIKNNFSKKNVFILHGKDKSSKDVWYPWLKQKLEFKNFNTIVPDLPNTKNPDMDEWVKVLKSFELNENSILIGHSRGGVAILKFLENLNVKVKAVFLVATNEQGFNYNYQNIKKNSQEFYVFHSKDDDVVPFHDAEVLVKNLNAKFFIFENKRHFGNSSSTFEVPEILEKVLKSCEDKSFEKYVEDIEKTFSESVSAHMIADKSVEVGAFLSGGVDSAYTVAEVAKHVKPKTFTIGFTEEKYSEASEARHTANLLSVENTEVKVSAESYLENVKNVQWHMDEPLGNPSANLLFELAKETGKHVKAVLSGEGADEMFGGYNVYKEPLALESYQKIPLFIRQFLDKTFSGFGLPGKNFISRGVKSIEERYVGNSNVFSLEDQKKVLQEKYFDKNWNPLNETKKVWELLEKTSCHPAEILSETKNLLQDPGKFKLDSAIKNSSEQKEIFPQNDRNFVCSKKLDDISKMQFLDIHMWMIQEILLKADKMSMAHSLELRVPFLDKEIWNIGRSIPINFKVNKTNTKLALRSAAFKVLDKASSERKKKAFPSPLPEWLKREDFYNKIKEEFESEIADKYFNKNYLLQILDEHKNAQRNNVRKIWTIYTFLVWYKVFFIK